MAEQSKKMYPDLGEVMNELGLSLKLDLIGEAPGSSEQTYTFETHPFYSTLRDYSEVQFPDSK